MCIPERKNLHNWRLKLCKYKYKVKTPIPRGWKRCLNAVRAQAGAILQAGGAGVVEGAATHRGLVQGVGAFRTRGAGVLLLECRRGKGETHGSPVLWDWRRIDGQKTHRGSQLGAARAHRPECRQLPGSARSHRGWWESLGHAGAGVRAEKPKTSPGRSCFAKSSQVVTTGGKSREDTRPAQPVANGHDRRRGNGAISTDETEVDVRKWGKRELAWGSSGYRRHRAPHRRPRAGGPGGDTVDVTPAQGRPVQPWQDACGGTAAGWQSHRRGPARPGVGAPVPRTLLGSQAPLRPLSPTGTPFDSQRNRQGK